MARYLITYDNGHDETVEAKCIEPSGSQYIGWAEDGSACAYIPIANVLSVVRLADENAPKAVTD
ncbi:hypothetical protein [Streptomyces swartbergensis]|uniref:Uncharacterized protein n=1 Tax=Streptomyces swartbergensis TaxID=487165 RepID=A0A243SAE1_9ACTN|nr:hypothetical protein [Streptomyces swartbergensis]OUD04685.1 hypothetical protein CA983_02715 [Streptomyces swartbergensis]